MNVQKLLTIAAGISLTVLCSTIVAQPDYAVDGLYEHGAYLGMTIGYVDPHNDKIHYFNDDSAFVPSASSKIGGRFFAGYAHNDFYSGELGYSRLIHAKSGDSHTYLSAFDAVAKFTLPMNIYFSAFAKTGLAYVMQDFKNVNSAGTTIYRKDNKRVLAKVAGGGSFHVTSRFEVQAVISHLFGRGGIDNITVYGLGLQYTF